MNKERLMKIIARLEWKIMDLEEALDRAQKMRIFGIRRPTNGEQKDDA